MVDGLPLKMRKPRKARAVCGTDEAWYYISPRTLEVYAEYRAPGQQDVTTAVQFTRRQLEQALKIMDDFREGV